MRVLAHARIPELPNPYYGKVRDCYDLPPDAEHPEGRRILIASDRVSAFDRILAAIPFKGQVLTGVARFWFERTSDIIANDNATGSTIVQIGAGDKGFSSSRCGKWTKQ